MHGWLLDFWQRLEFPGFPVGHEKLLKFISVCYTVIEEVLNVLYDQWQNWCYWVCSALCKDFNTLYCQYTDNKKAYLHLLGKRLKPKCSTYQTSCDGVRIRSVYNLTTLCCFGSTWLMLSHPRQWSLHTHWSIVCLNIPVHPGKQIYPKYSRRLRWLLYQKCFWAIRYQTTSLLSSFANS